LSSASWCWWASSAAPRASWSGECGVEGGSWPSRTRDQHRGPPVPRGLAGLVDAFLGLGAQAPECRGTRSIPPSLAVLTAWVHPGSHSATSSEDHRSGTFSVEWLQGAVTVPTSSRLLWGSGTGRVQRTPHPLQCGAP
jgi:hypothetical protein